jgi:hypothetical protein
MQSCFEVAKAQSLLRPTRAQPPDDVEMDAVELPLFWEIGNL